MTWDIIHGDARELPLGDASVDLIVTSPPYWGLRSYRDGGEHYDGQVGSEDSPQQFVDELASMIDGEWRRVLKPVGSLWLNLGDKYAGSGGHNNAGLAHQNGPIVGTEQATTRRDGPNRYPQGLESARPKSLLGLPWRVALALIDRGWILRAEVIWSKPNGLPESVTDRVRRSHEQWFHFVLEPQYFSAVDEIREPANTDRPQTARAAELAATLTPEQVAAIRSVGVSDTGRGAATQTGTGKNRPEVYELADQARQVLGGYAREFLGDGATLGRLPGSVWSVPTEPLIIPDSHREAFGLPDHFAAFPTEWPRRIIQGWSPSGVCVECGEGRRPVVDKQLAVRSETNWGDDSKFGGTREAHMHNRMGVDEPIGSTEATITGYACACPTPDAPTRPAVILDPMCGTGTVPGVAHKLGRHGIGVDLSGDYVRLARWRIESSGHFDKVDRRMLQDRQGTLL